MRRVFKPYDVFISYVTEDREIVEQLNDALRKRGLRVWYAKEQLFPGAEIRKLIDAGLSQSQFGVALISPSYSSHWALGELFVLMREKEVLIPVLHETTVEQMAIQHPELITRYCLNTNAGIEQVAEDITQYIKKESSFRGWLKKCAPRGRKSTLLFSLVALVLISLFLYSKPSSDDLPEEELIKEYVIRRISNLDKQIQEQIEQEFKQYQAVTIDFEALRSSMEACENDSSTERNLFHFLESRIHIKTQKELKATGIVPNTPKIVAPFGLTEFSTWKFMRLEQSNSCLGYSLINTLPLEYEFVASRAGKDLCEVDIHYPNFLRYVQVIITFDSLDNKRVSHHNLAGIKPNETYVFEKGELGWVFSEIR